MEKKKVCFIRAKQKEDYVVSGIQKSGYKVVIPYKDYNLLLRLCREVWFHLKLPKRELWINSEVRNIKEDIIIVKDPLIVPEFLKNLRGNHPRRRIIFDYDNRVSRSLDPRTIIDYVDEIWSYDKDDCKAYNLRYKGNCYYDIYQVKQNQNPRIDVFYVGRDKGRLEAILDIQKKLEQVGLKTYFHICATRSFLTWTKKIYKPFLPYNKYLELLRDSKAVLNIVPEGQTSISQREMEAVFDGIKCITNNRGILGFPLYDKTRFFLLSDNNVEDIQDFLETRFSPISNQDLYSYRFESNLSDNLEGK